MAGDDSDERFTMSILAPARIQLRQWADDASRLGRRGECLEALGRTLERLELDPLEWGDPLFEYPTVAATAFRGMIPGWWLVWYDVDEVEKKVAVRSVLPAPGSPLTADNPPT